MKSQRHNGGYLAHQFLPLNKLFLGIFERHFGKMKMRNKTVYSLTDGHGNTARKNPSHRTLQTHKYSQDSYTIDRSNISILSYKIAAIIRTSFE